MQQLPITETVLQHGLAAVEFVFRELCVEIIRHKSFPRGRRENYQQPLCLVEPSVDRQPGDDRHRVCDMIFLRLLHVLIFVNMPIFSAGTAGVCRVLVVGAGPISSDSSNADDLNLRRTIW